MKSSYHKINASIKSLTIKKSKYELALEKIQKVDCTPLELANDEGDFNEHLNHSIAELLRIYSETIKEYGQPTYLELFALKDGYYGDPTSLEELRATLRRFSESSSSSYYSIVDFKVFLEKKIKRIKRDILSLQKLLSRSAEIDKRKLFRSIIRFSVKNLDDTHNTSNILKPFDPYFKNNIRRHYNENKKYRCLN